MKELICFSAQQRTLSPRQNYTAGVILIVFDLFGKQAKLKFECLYFEVNSVGPVE